MYLRALPPIVLGLAALLLVSAASARPGGHHRHHGHHGMDEQGFIQENAERLGLSEETRTAIEGIVDDSHARAATLHDAHREARHALKDLLSQDAPDEATVMARAEELGRIETELSKHRLATMLRIRALLSPEQRSQLLEIRREKRARKEAAREACAAEIEQWCPDADSSWDRMRCLRENEARLSEKCAAALEPMGCEHGHGPGPAGE
jgi:Spy/CpxP family protein refolding chaperone